MSEFYDYNTRNMLTAMTKIPSTAHNIDNRTAMYFRKYLMQKAMSVFKWELPEGWNRDYFLYTLYCYGYIAIFKTPEFGVIPQQCTLNGYDIFYAPKNVLVANPLLPQTHQLEIDTECILLKLESDYTGVLDLVNYYVAKLSLCSEALDMNLQNSKLAYLFTATDKASAESFKKLFDKVQSGEPAVIIDKALKDEDGNSNWDSFSNDLKQNYLVTDLLSDMRKLESMFDTEIGIPNANTDKRERLITDEVNANNVETATRAEMWLEQLKAGCQKANDMFGINLNVDWRVNPYESESISNWDVQSQQ